MPKPSFGPPVGTPALANSSARITCSSADSPPPPYSTGQPGREVAGLVERRAPRRDEVARPRRAAAGRCRAQSRRQLLGEERLDLVAVCLGLGTVRGVHDRRCVLKRRHGPPGRHGSAYAATVVFQRARAAAPTSGASRPSVVNSMPHAVLAAVGAGAHVGEAAALVELAAGGVEERLAERRRHGAGEHDEAEVEHGDGRGDGAPDHHPGALDDRCRSPPQRPVGLLLDRRQPRRRPSGSRCRRRRTAARRARRRRGRAGRRCRAGRAAAGRCRSHRPRRRPTAAAPSRRRRPGPRPSSTRRGRGPGPSVPRTVGSPVSSPTRSRSSKDCHTGRCSGDTVPLTASIGPSQLTPQRSSGIDVVGPGGDDPAHEAVQGRPHVARRGGDPVAHDHLAGRVDHAGGQPVGADVDRQVGRHRATVRHRG